MTDENSTERLSYDAIRALQQTGRWDEAVAALEALDEAARTPEFMALHGLVLLQRHDEAGRDLVLAALDTAEGREPQTSALASDLGFGLILSGEPERALALLERAVTLPGPDGAAFNRLGAARHIAGDVQGARQGYEEALKRDPHRPEILCNLAVIVAGLGELDESLGYYDRALRLNADLDNAIAGRASLLAALERVDEAALELEERVEREEDPAREVALRMQLAHVLDAGGRFEEAVVQLRQAAECDEEAVLPLMQLAALCFGRLRPGVALWALDKAMERREEHLPALCLKARVLAELGREEAADEAVAKAFELAPEDPACHLARGEVRSATGDMAGAVTDMERAVDMAPGWAEAWSSLGQQHLLAGNMDEAVEAWKKAAELNPSALAGLVSARVYPEEEATLETMRRLAANVLAPAEARAAMHFALAEVWDKRGEAADAFGHADEANALARRVMRYEPGAAERFVEGLLDACTPEFFRRFQGAGGGSEVPVFVCGMPRSGTTLTEQILASHPDVFGAGELGVMSAITRLMPKVIGTGTAYPECLALFEPWMAGHAAHYYLTKIGAMVRAADAPSPRRVVDKMPHNFQHLGLVACVFPRARIIHVRRDPRDIAVSNYFTNFRHKHGALGYAFDLTHLAGELNRHARIMAHWHEVLPVPIFELHYERLVAEPEAVIRELLDFTGLDWDEHVLQFHETKRPVKTASVWQVRQPLYASSKGRWHRYESFFEPLIQALEPGTLAGWE